MFFRPVEVETLQGGYTKASNELNWKPTMTFNNLVKSMVSHDILINGIS